MHGAQETNETDAMRKAAWNNDRLGQEAELRRVGQNQVPFKEFGTIYMHLCPATLLNNTLLLLQLTCGCAVLGWYCRRPVEALAHPSANPSPSPSPYLRWAASNGANWTTTAPHSTPTRLLMASLDSAQQFRAARGAQAGSSKTN